MLSKFTAINPSIFKILPFYYGIHRKIIIYLNFSFYFVKLFKVLEMFHSLFLFDYGEFHSILKKRSFLSSFCDNKETRNLAVLDMHFTLYSPVHNDHKFKEPGSSGFSRRVWLYQNFTWSRLECDTNLLEACTLVGTAFCKEISLCMYYKSMCSYALFTKCYHIYTCISNKNTNYFVVCREITSSISSKILTPTNPVHPSVQNKDIQYDI